MKHQSDRRPAIFVLNDPTAPRLNPELAKEIGLNESLLFLQLEFWLRQSGTLQEDGQYWIYESLSDIQEVFGFWGRETINRIIHSLIEQELLQVGNWNVHAYDKTRWFTLNRTGIDRLKSIKVFDWWLSQNETGLSQNETPLSQNETGLSQNETTIPDSSPDLSADLSSEEEDAACGDSPPTFPEPEQSIQDPQERLNGMRERLGRDPFSVARNCEQARAKAEHPDFTDASKDVASWKQPFDQFCCLFPMLDPDRVQGKKRENWMREIHRLAEEVQASPQQAADVMRPLARLEAWMVKPSTTPYKTSWAEAFQNALLCEPELLQAQVNALPQGEGGASTGRKEPEPTGWSAYAELMKERHGKDWAVEFAR